MDPKNPNPTFNFNYLLLVVFLACGFVTKSRAMEFNANSENEEAALNEFRELADHLTYREFMKSDAYLIRWLRETNFDVSEAYDKLSKSMNWRHTKNIDSVVNEDFTNIDDEHHYVIDRFDKDGRPVLYVPFGTYNIRKIAISGSEEHYQRFMIRSYELGEIYLHEIRTNTGRSNITNCVGIYDLAGFNLKTGACYQCISMIPELVLNFDSNYPGIFYKAILINTPKIFLNALNMAENFMSAKTRETLAVYGYDKNEWIAALHKQIPATQLPVEYGGTQPSFHSKLVKNAHTKFMADLVERARMAAEKDLSYDDTSDHRSGSDNISSLTFNAHMQDAQTPQEDQTIQFQGHHKKRHQGHHHYSPQTGQDPRANSRSSLAIMLLSQSESISISILVIFIGYSYIIVSTFFE